MRTFTLWSVLLAVLLPHAVASAEPPPAPTLATIRSWPTSVKVAGGLDRHIVERIYLKREALGLHLCFAQHVRSGHDYDEITVLLMVRDSDPPVAHAAVSDNTTGSEAFAACVQEKARTWRFPTGRICGIDRVEMTLRFIQRPPSRSPSEP